MLYTRIWPTAEFAEEMPQTLATWLKERELEFPGVGFEIRPEVAPDTPEYQNYLNKYSQLFSFRNRTQITFCFPKTTWTVRVVCGTDKDGNIIDINDSEATEKLPNDVWPPSAKLRERIVDFRLGPEIEQLDEFNFGKIRAKESVPEDYVPVEILPDGRVVLS